VASDAPQEPLSAGPRRRRWRYLVSQRDNRLFVNDQNSKGSSLTIRGVDVGTVIGTVVHGGGASRLAKEGRALYFADERHTVHQLRRTVSSLASWRHWSVANQCVEVFTQPAGQNIPSQPVGMPRHIVNCRMRRTSP
jgi:hypothetical protein